MNYLDIVLLILLLLGALNGFRIGLIQSLTNMLGWVLALLFAVKFYPVAQPYFQWVASSEWLQQVSAFTAIIIAIVVLSWVVSSVLQSIFKHLKLAPLNRLMGAIFGLVKSATIIFVFIHILTPWLSASPIWQQSQLIKTLSPYAPVAVEWSQQMTQKVIKSVNDVNIQGGTDLEEKKPQEMIKNPFSK